MNNQTIKNIIKEEIEQISNINMFDSVEYLKKFKFIDYKEVGDKKIWLFGRKIDSYKIKFYIINDNNKWSCKLLVFWKKITRPLTLGSGKDIEIKFGNFDSLKQMVEELNNKLKNNLLLTPIIYHDDWEFNMDKEALPLLQKLKEVGEELMKIKDVHFDDLKKIYADIKGINEPEELIKHCQKIAPKEEDKQNLLLHLQKMQKIPFYSGMERMMHI